MATIETWATEKIAEYGAIYPMVGSEWVWLTVADCGYGLLAGMAL